MDFSLIFLTKLPCPADSVVWCRDPIIEAPDEDSVYLMEKGQFFLRAEVKESLSGKRAEIQRIYSEVYQLGHNTSLFLDHLNKRNYLTQHTQDIIVGQA